MTSSPTDEPRTRPRNRRAMIIEAAGDLFHRSGYHLVGLTDIAAVVGVTGPAIYRHFGNKQELLYRTIAEGFDVIESAMGEEDGLDPLVARLSAAAVQQRRLGLLWQRERRHLSAEQRAELTEQLEQITDGIARRVSRHRIDTTAEGALFLARCTLATLSSPSYHAVELPEGRLGSLLRDATLAVCATHLPVALDDVPAHDEAPTGGGSLSGRRASRRERLLATTIEQVARRGFAGVTMEAIGVEVGISAPSIYNHFSSKVELLTAAVSRGGEALHLTLSEILGTSGTAEEALERLLTAYADFATRQPEMIRVLISELPHLPEAERTAARRTQREYVSEWTRLLTEARADLDAAEARCRVQASLTIANDISWLPRHHRRVDLVANIAAAARAPLVA